MVYASGKANASLWQQETGLPGGIACRITGTCLGKELDGQFAADKAVQFPCIQLILCIDHQSIKTDSLPTHAENSMPTFRNSVEKVHRFGPTHTPWLIAAFAFARDLSPVGTVPSRCQNRYLMQIAGLSAVVAPVSHNVRSMTSIQLPSLQSSCKLTYQMAIR